MSGVEPCDPAAKGERSWGVCVCLSPLYGSLRNVLCLYAHALYVLLCVSVSTSFTASSLLGGMQVQRAERRWRKEAAQMANDYRGFRPPHPE